MAYDSKIGNNKYGDRKKKGEMRHGDLSKEVIVVHVDYANKISIEKVVKEHFLCFQKAQVDRTGHKTKFVIGRLLR